MKCLSRSPPRAHGKGIEPSFLCTVPQCSPEEGAASVGRAEVKVDKQFCSEEQEQQLLQRKDPQQHQHILPHGLYYPRDLQGISSYHTHPAPLTSWPQNGGPKHQPDMTRKALKYHVGKFLAKLNNGNHSHRPPQSGGDLSCALVCGPQQNNGGKVIPDRAGWDLGHKAEMGAQPGPCNLREDDREQCRKGCGREASDKGVPHSTVILDGKAQTRGARFDFIHTSSCHFNGLQERCSALRVA